MSIFVTLGPQEAEKSTKTECHMFFGTPCNCLYITQFLTNFSQILDSKSYDQA